MFVSVTLDLLHPEMAYLPGALGWFRRSNLVNCVKLCHTCVTLCQLCVFRLNTPCVTPSCTKAKNPAGMVMMRLKDMRNGIFRGMILGGKKVASFEQKKNSVSSARTETESCIPVLSAIGCNQIRHWHSIYCGCFSRGLQWERKCRNMPRGID